MLIRINTMNSLKRIRIAYCLSVRVIICLSSNDSQVWEKLLVPHSLRN